jgi:hypothetical protein
LQATFSLVGDKWRSDCIDRHQNRRVVSAAWQLNTLDSQEVGEARRAAIPSDDRGSLADHWLALRACWRIWLAVGSATARPPIRSSVPPLIVTALIVPLALA